MRLSQPVAPNGAPLVVIRRDLLQELGCPVAAALLNAMQRWSAHLNNDWMQRTVEQWAEELLHVWSVSRVRRALAALVKSGRVERRRNPRWKQTRTYQYRVVLPSPPPPPQQQQATRVALKLEPLRVPPLKLPNRIIDVSNTTVETPDLTLQVTKIDLSYNKTEYTDTTETKQTPQPVVVAATAPQEEPESVRLLIAAGVAPAAARDLCPAITEQRARDVIAAATDKRDPAGWIVAALRHNWAVPPRPQLPSLSDPTRYSAGLYAEFLEQPTANLAASATGAWSHILQQLRHQNPYEWSQIRLFELVQCGPEEWMLNAPRHLRRLAELYLHKITWLLRHHLSSESITVKIKIAAPCPIGEDAHGIVLAEASSLCSPTGEPVL